MEDMFRSATEDVLTHCAEDVALIHKHVAPGHRVSPVTLYAHVHVHIRNPALI